MAQTGEDVVSGTLARVSILILDDSQHIRRLLSTMLRAMGAQNIFEAKDSTTAMQQLYKGTTDIAILDWMLDDGTGRTGIDLVGEIRSSNMDELAFMPIIMMTGHTEKENIEMARDKGITEFLAKPFTAKTLYSRIAALVESPRPFVKTRTFFGPDRRRRQEDPPTQVGERRRYTIPHKPS